MTAFLKDVNGYGTHAARPAAGSAGVLYYETDTQEIFRDNGSSWDGLTIGGAASALTKLDEHIIGSGGAASIAFSSIAGTYRSLQIVMQGRGDASSANEPVELQFNGDTAANYDWTETLGYATSTVLADQAEGATSGYCAYVPGATASANSAGTSILWIPNYAGTTFHKAWSGRGQWIQATTGVMGFDFILGGRWRSTVAITSILLFPASGNFVQGTVATLYGLS